MDVSPPSTCKSEIHQLGTMSANPALDLEPNTAAHDDVLARSEQWRDAICVFCGSSDGNDPAFLVGLGTGTAGFLVNLPVERILTCLDSPSWLPSRSEKLSIGIACLCECVSRILLEDAALNLARCGWPGYPACTVAERTVS